MSGLFHTSSILAVTGSFTGVAGIVQLWTVHNFLAGEIERKKGGKLVPLRLEVRLSV